MVTIPSEELALLTTFYNEMKPESGPSGSHSVPVPRFHDKPPDDGDGIFQKVREEARSRFLQKKSKELLDNGKLKEIWEVLEQKHTPPVVDDEKMIALEPFMRVAEKVPENARQFFSHKIFVKLQQRDPYGRISILTFFNYIMRKTWLRQSRIGLSLYDVTGMLPMSNGPLGKNLRFSNALLCHMWVSFILRSGLPV